MIAAMDLKIYGSAWVLLKAEVAHSKKKKQYPVRGPTMCTRIRVMK